jgi:hypothetical protein
MQPILSNLAVSLKTLMFWAIFPLRVVLKVIKDAQVSLRHLLRDICRAIMLFSERSWSSSVFKRLSSESESSVWIFRKDPSDRSVDDPLGFPLAWRG